MNGGTDGLSHVAEEKNNTGWLALNVDGTRACAISQVRCSHNESSVRKQLFFFAVLLALHHVFNTNRFRTGDLKQQLLKQRTADRLVEVFVLKSQPHHSRKQHKPLTVGLIKRAPTVSKAFLVGENIRGSMQICFHKDYPQFSHKQHGQVSSHARTTLILLSISLFAAFSSQRIQRGLRGSTPSPRVCTADWPACRSTSLRFRYSTSSL